MCVRAAIGREFTPVGRPTLCRYPQRHRDRPPPGRLTTRCHHPHSRRKASPRPNLIGVSNYDKLASAPVGKFYAANPIELLWRAVKARIDDYDIVMVDCPPNLGIITLNGLRISDGYIIPTIPDHLSTYGIPQIVTRIKDFSEAISETIEPIGIVATKYQANLTVHNNVLKQLRDDEKIPAVMETIIRQANQVAAAAEFQTYPRTLKQKYGSELANQYDELAHEIWNQLEGGL